MCATFKRLRALCHKQSYKSCGSQGDTFSRLLATYGQPRIICGHIFVHVGILVLLVERRIAFKFTLLSVEEKKKKNLLSDDKVMFFSLSTKKNKVDLEHPRLTDKQSSMSY